MTALTVMLATRFMMSAFPAAERRKDELPWAALVSLTDPMLRPVRRLLQLVRGIAPVLWWRAMRDSPTLDPESHLKWRRPEQADMLLARMTAIWTLRRSPC